MLQKGPNSIDIPSVHALPYYLFQAHYHIWIYTITLLMWLIFSQMYIQIHKPIKLSYTDILYFNCSTDKSWLLLCIQ
jgi:hypothetical protein